MMELDNLHRALICFQKREFEAAAEACTKVLAKNPYDQAAWCLKARCLTEQVYVDEVENDEAGLAESLLEDHSIAQVARPGTSLIKPGTGAGNGMQSQSVRPRTNTGRPLSGMARPGTQGRPGTMEQALKAPRTAKTARPVTSSTGRHVRLGTASMLSNPDGPFINISRLNFDKYAAQVNVAKPLFEYLFYHEGDIRSSLQLAAKATAAAEFKDWYWKVQLGKCYYRLGMLRDAEKQFKSAGKDETCVVETALYLGKVYVRLDQPLTAIETFKKALEQHPHDTSLLTGLARIHEGLNDMNKAVECYKLVLKQDSTNVEAIACIGTNHFYNDQPELALRFYRRLLQMGVSNAELFTNIGLCCFYAQQFDLSTGCFERALSLADNETGPDVWYNMGHVALASGDTSMAYQCFRLALAVNNEHAESCCNLGVLEMRKGNSEQAKTLFQSAMKLGSYTYEPFYNYALLSYELGDFQSSFTAVTRSLEIFPEHADSAELKRRLGNLLSAI